MSEYVVDITGVRTVIGTNSVDAVSLAHSLPVREQIVRCKDCKHMREFHPVSPITGVPCGITITKCSYWWNPDELPEVDPNDFCSNGELREDA